MVISNEEFRDDGDDEDDDNNQINVKNVKKNHNRPNYDNAIKWLVEK